MTAEYILDQYGPHVFKLAAGRYSKVFASISVAHVLIMVQGEPEFTPADCWGEMCGSPQMVGSNCRPQMDKQAFTLTFKP